MSGTLEIQATMTCSMMPNQFEGMVNGVPFYYRARHGDYSLELYIGSGEGIIVDSGESKNAGWWERRTAFRMLRRSIYRAAKRGLIPYNSDLTPKNGNKP